MMDALFANSGLKLLENFQRWGLNLEVASTPCETIEQLGNMRLLRYSHSSENPLPPLFLVPSLINRFYVLDLLPEKSFIAFLAKSFSVYVIDWGEAQDEEKGLSLEKLLELHFDFFFKTVLHDASVEKVHLVGHCLGGDLGLIWSLVHPEQVASLSLLTTPLDFSVPGKLQTWAQYRDFNVASLVHAYGHAPWPLLQMAFLGLKPSQLFSKYRRILQKLNDPRSLRTFMALESWSADNRSVRGACYRDVIELFYRQNCFLQKGFLYKGKRYLLRDLQVPVAAISATDDHIIPGEATLKPEMVPLAKAVQIWHSSGGHIGGLLGQASQNEIWPSYVDWLLRQEKKHEQQQAAI